MNKKAQLGKIITALPVMFAIFLVMAGFVLLSVSARGVISPQAFKSDVPLFVYTSYLGQDLGKTLIYERYILVDNKVTKIKDELLRVRSLTYGDEQKFASEGAKLIKSISDSAASFP